MNIIPAVDSSLYSSYGMKNDYQSIFSYMNINYKDSAPGGYWRNMSMQNNGASLFIVGSSLDKARITPDVTGMGLKDAVYMLENKGLIVEAKGRGRVLNQSLIAGTNFTKGQKISLMLN